jgi:hypothetical protein
MTQHPPPPPWGQPDPYGQPDPRQWQNYGHQPYPGPPPKPSFWRGKGGALVVLFGALTVAFSLSSNSAETTSRTTATSAARSSAVPVAPTYPAAAAPVQAAPAEIPAATRSGPKTSFGDGTWVVGEEIVPGTYKTAGAKEGLFEYCQITTHSDTTADSDHMLDWKNGNADEPIRVNISGKVKSVKASGCEDFVKVG